MLNRLLLISSVIVGFATSTRAQVINVPDDFVTIQEAIDAAVNGDTVIVDDGTYQEQINFSGKAITVGSRYVANGDTTHIANTIIDGSSFAGNDSASVVYFTSGEDTTSVLSGLTITGGSGTPLENDDFETFVAGGGIYVLNSGAKILNNRISGNSISSPSAGAGAGLVASSDSAGHFIIVEQNLFEANAIDADTLAAGGGLAFDMEARVVDNIILSNSVRSSVTAGGGGLFVIQNEPRSGQVVRVHDNLIQGNRAQVITDQGVAVGAGVAVGESRVELVGNRIRANRAISVAQSSGAGVFVADTAPGDTVVVKNNVIANNGFGGGPLVGGGIFVINVPAFEIRGNTVQANSAALGGGLMIADSDGVLSGNDIDENTVSNVGGGLFLQTSDALVHLNRFTENRAFVGGGAFVVESGAAFVQNLIAHNATTDGGGGLWLEKVFSKGVSKAGQNPGIGLQRLHFVRGLRPAVWEPGDYLSRTGKNRAFIADPQLINNTVVQNQALGGFGGGGVSAILSSPVLMNMLVRQNAASDGAQIDGAVVASFSNIEGGYPGFGNIDAASQFDGLFYEPGDGSPDIDAGNPDPLFDDIEDPSNPGVPLRGSGTLRNDIGYTGGSVIGLDPVRILGPRFRALAQYVADHPNPADQNAAVDSFLTSLTSYPLIDGDRIVTFLYEGAASRVNVPGDANGWSPDAFPMSRLGATDLWFRQAICEPDARLDYKFVIDGQNWILDSRNPNTVAGGFGPNSELRMPAYEEPAEIEFDPFIDHGRLDAFGFPSTILGNTRNVTVYLPPGYSENPDTDYPVIVFHDGGEYLSLASADNVLDNLIAAETIQPLIAVFVPPGNRNAEYAFDQRLQYEAFIVEELMAHIDTTYRTKSNPVHRGTLGISFGGLISAQICMNRPSDFGLCVLHSPAFWPNEKRVLGQWLSGPQRDTRVYVDWGTYEINIMSDGRTLRDRLIDRGNYVAWNEWHDGHSWGNWRGHLDLALGAMFPGIKPTSSAEEIPTGENRLLRNYPNPFAGKTQITFETLGDSDVTVDVFNMLGQQVVRLASGTRAAGIHRLLWDARAMAPGLYLVRVEIDGEVMARTVILSR